MDELGNAVSGEASLREQLARRDTLAFWAPLRVSFRRAAGEAILGWLVLAVLAALSHPGAPSPALYRPPVHGVWTAVALASWAWLVVWPAWRLRLVRGAHWWTRLPKGLGRLWLLGLASGLICMGMAGVARLWPLDLRGSDLSTAAEGIVVVLVLMTMLRIALVIAAAVRRWTRTRLQRQLMVSHLFVIMMTFVGLLGVSSITAAVVVVNNLPDSISQARAIAHMLAPGLGGNGINRYRAQDILLGLEKGRLRPVDLGGSPLNLFLPWNVVNRRIELVSSNGALLAAATNTEAVSRCNEQQPNLIAPSAVRSRLIRTALAGKTGSATAHFASTCTGNGLEETVAAVPILGQHGQPIAVVLVRGMALQPAAGQVIGALLFGFTAATVALIMVTVLPTLALSSLVALYFARGLTRRIGAVSRAAAALSAGDLSQRVPVSAKNEIGQLATDFNRMATRLEEIMSELRTARTTAEEALQARQDLVASVSHELRTPIAIVQAHLDALQGVDGTADARENGVQATTMQALQHEMHRLADMVDDLFILARAGTDVMQVYCVPTDVGGVVREVAALLRPLAQREGALTLTAETQPGLPLALADGDRLRQILANLVRNAVRHTPEGGIIALGAAAEDRWLVLSVADTGEGIAPEHLPHIFERFYRVDKARTRASGGAGLGLAIVKEFVELMGGHVRVESALNEGTCFRVYLPAVTAYAQTPVPVPAAS